VKSAKWLWIPGMAALVVALFLAENGLSVASSALGFFLVALGMGTFLLCAVSPALPFSRVAIPGAAFIATVAYSVYLTHKLPIHEIDRLRTDHSLPAVIAYLIMLAAVLVLGSGLFFAVERPFLRMRERGKRPMPNEKVSSHTRGSKTAPDVIPPA
jgi:peptidoglycan/LPS O-acetylase OafA/YrhL